MEQSLNERSSLQLIESMINKAKNNFSESGTLYLVWGIVIFACSITQFIATYFYDYQNAYYVWFLTWLVLIYQFIFLAKKKKKENVKTYTGEILGYVWLCFIICLFVLMFILQYSKAYELINTVILVLYAIPSFLSGGILKVKSLIVGGICCWLLAVFSIFIPREFNILLISAAVLVAWIIPGLIMRNKFLNQQNHGR